MLPKKFSLWIGLMVLLVSFISCQLPTDNNVPEGEPRPTTAPDLRRLPPESSDTVRPTTETGDQPYTHPSQTFQIIIPAGWVIDTDENGSMYAYEPEGEGAIYITITYTGHNLSAADFERFVAAREENFFNYFVNYQPAEFEMNTAKDWAVYRKSVDFNEIPETVDTYYYRINHAVFTMDIWMETAQLAEYETLYQPVIDSFTAQSEGVENFYLYNFVWVFRDTLDTFSFETPISWTYTYREVNGTLEDRFWAPDEKAALTHHLVYQVGSLSESELETMVIEQLQSSFPAFTNSLVVTEREEITDGVYRLSWDSKQSGWLGSVIYRVYENNLLFLNGMVAADFEASYLSTIQYGLDYYAVPAVVEE